VIFHDQIFLIGDVVGAEQGVQAGDVFAVLQLDEQTATMKNGAHGAAVFRFPMIVPKQKQTYRTDAEQQYLKFVDMIKDGELFE
jgi:hypothetical protein